SASIIASDKTGTLTQNKMTLQRIWVPNHDISEVEDEFNDHEEWILKMMALSSNVKPSTDEEGKLLVEGNPTEAAIIRTVEEKGWSKESLNKKYKRVYEFPFDSKTKRMTTIHEHNNGNYI